MGRRPLAAASLPAAAGGCAAVGLGRQVRNSAPTPTRNLLQWPQLQGDGDFRPILKGNNWRRKRSLNLTDDPPLSINDLPNEILLQIFFYLSVDDIALNVQFVCSRWSELELPYEAFKNLVSECPKLEEITIAGSALVREELAELVGQWEYLNDIYFIGRSDKPIALKYLAEGCPAIQHLHMRYVVCSFTELEYFLEKKKNKLLSLSISPLTQDGRCVIPLLDICKDRLEKCS
ncbi:uncharacterized protein LOC124775143 [Schistocerca piceifrons]|uniref:uncharacterized protein LOC124775143 n=1 Tax=Schistocerca piceifrons TaxID=274613 RepID=UPI001F5F06BF|nr:uncharacterized protein LOC124775143 [Schistocerca piceifrons]